MDKKLVLKAHIQGFTRKDGAFVAAHDDKRQAAKPKPAWGMHGGSEKKPAGGYSVAPFKHGGHQIKEPDGKNHVILQDKGVADRHSAALNHVSQTGKGAHMDESISAAAKKHLGLDSFDEVGSDREDFVDTGKSGLKAALHHAYDAGAGHSNGGTHRDGVVAEAGKHFGQFDSLDTVGSDREDFKEVSKGLLKHALKHAYASGAHGGAKKPAAKKPAGAGDYIPPAEGDVGHEEHKAYGKYFRKGDTVKDGSGKTHEVVDHHGPQVRTASGGNFHPTKLDFVSGAKKPAPMQKSMLVIDADLLK
jgi:hypothetical protein